MHRPLLKPKLAPPRPWAGVIARPRLEAALDDAIATGAHVGVFAGPGYGKTALLAAWARARGAAWLTLDADDAEPDAFLAYLIAAFEGAVPGFATEARGLLGRAREREGAFAALAALMADLDEQCAKPLVLVVDDLHLAASPTIDALAGRLLRYLPPAVRLVLASRRPPDVGLAALQAQEALRVLDEPALAFDAAELAALRPASPPAELAATLAATGGWPAAMGLTAELLDAFVEEQVLAGLPAETLAFLRRVAVVDAFDAAFCEDVIGPMPPRAQWEHLKRERLVAAIGQGRHALHPALRTYLARRFEADVPREEREALLARIEAHHAREAGRLAEVADAWLAAGRLDALATAVAALGPAAERPDMLWLRAELRRRWGEFDEAGRLYQRVLGADDALAAARARLGLAQVTASRGDVAGARAHLAGLAGHAGRGGRAGEGGPGLGWPVAAAIDEAILEGGLALLSAETEQAVARYEGALALAQRAGDPYGEARALHNLGICTIRMGEFARALALYDRALALTAADGTPLVWMAPINRALVLVHLGQPEEGAAAAEAALAVVRRYKLVREEGYALRILGFAHLRRGSAAAEPCFEAAERLARREGDALGLAYSLNFRAECALARGDAAAAEGLADEVDKAMGGREAASGILDFAQVRAKVLMALGRREEARTRLGALLEKARSQGYVHVAQETAALAARLEAGASAVVPAAEPPPAPDAEAAEPALAIRCFGGLRVTREGAAVADREWRTSKAKQLLAFLAFTPEGATKETLLAAVFPGEEVSNDHMNMTIMRLRKALEPGLAKGQPSRWILRQGGRYLFNRQAPVAIDVDAFEAALRAARPGDPGEAAALLRALDRYGGEFLPEVEAPWAVALRLRLQEAALGACRRLLALAEGQPAERAGEVLRRALEIDPLSEEFNRELILRHLEAGEQHLARQHFDLYARRYREVAGGAPPADLRDLVVGVG